MGSQQPKPIARVSKGQIDIGTLKARIHLQLVRERKHAEIIRVQKELVGKIKSKSRNKTEQILIAERVVLSLKYGQACDLLIGYAANLRLQSQFIAENMMNPLKMQPFLVMIYSLIYAADHMGLFSLSEFKALMRALNDPIALQKYVNPQIVNALAPSPSPEQLNVYMLEFSERNTIPLEEINSIGHKFTKQWKNIPSISPNFPSIPPSNPSIPPNTPGDFNPGKFNGGNPGQFNNGGMGGGNFNPYQNMDPRQFFNNNGNNVNPNNVPGNNPNNFPGNNGYNGQGNNPYNGQGNNPYISNSNNPINGQGNNANIGLGNNTYNGPTNPNNNQFIGANNNVNNQFGGNNGGNMGNNLPPYNKTPANLGPNIYVPEDITPKQKQAVKQSITSINDIDYYPQIDDNPAMFKKGGFNDPDFDQICERLKKGL